MVAVTIRNVPADIRDRLAARAAASGRSLQEFLVMELHELARRERPDELLDRARQRAAAHGSRLTVEQILEARDAGRR